LRRSSVADLDDSTELGERDPERTRAELERFHGAIVEEIARRAGTVEGFMGNAAMAVFGCPGGSGGPCGARLHAALAERTD